jgi:hypothetical protein
VTTSDVENLISNIDSAGHKTVLFIKDTASDFLINETSFIADGKENLVIVKQKIGNHPGRVSGHLVRETAYYFQNDSLLKVNKQTFDFNKLISSENYYFTTEGRREMKRKTRKYYLKEGEVFMKRFEEYLDTNGGKH